MNQYHRPTILPTHQPYPMFSLSQAADHLSRLEHLLATARDEYNTLAFVILEGATQVTYQSFKRRITLPIDGDDIGHINAMLAEAALKRIAALEKEITEAHAQVVSEADEHQLDADQLAAYREQARLAGYHHTQGYSEGEELASTATPNPDEHPAR
jgi:hypothetical protein